MGYYHYFGAVGKSFYIVAGLGFQTYDNEYETNVPSPGMLIGGGYEFARHFQFHASFSFGKTDAGLG